MTGQPKGETDEMTTGSTAAESLDIGELLTIDVDAELRKLATAQLQGPWQIPAELVRRSVAAGASQIDVRFGRHRVRIDDNGAALSEPHVRALAHLLDPQAAATLRHRALLDLESVGAVALLALAGISLTSLSLSCTGGERAPLHLEVRRGKPPKFRVGRPSGGDEPALTRIEIIAEGLEIKRARQWLEEATRFVGNSLTIDGKAGPDGFDDYLVGAAIDVKLGETSLKGRIWIPPTNDTPRLWILQHGVVATHHGLTKSPTFEVTLEVGAIAPPRATAADLRNLVAPTLSTLAKEAVRLLLAAGERMPAMGLAAQSRLLRLLLEAARLGLARPEIRRAPLIPCLVARDTPAVWRSIATLEAEGADTGRQPMIPALYPSQSTDDVIIGAVPIALLESSARSAITELFGLRFGPPPRLLGRVDGGDRLARLRERIADIAGGFATVLGLGAGRPLADNELSRAELYLLEQLRAVIPNANPEAPQEILFCRGRGRIRRPRGKTPRLLLPRDNADVRASVRAVADDAAWIYPACVVLLGGRSMPSLDARMTWLRGWSRH